ncbi:FkbM family methyltransferase [Xanthomonas sp. Kuri4-1]
MQLASPAPDAAKLAFCHDFIHSGRPRYVFGRNDFAVEIDGLLQLSGFIDERSPETRFLGKPVLHRLDELPADAMVVFVSCMRPLTVARKLEAAGVDFVDYFFFQKHSGLPLSDIPHWVGFAEDYAAHRPAYDRLYARMSDEPSRDTLRRLVAFRLHRDLTLMQPFSDRMEAQYFEDFLPLGQDTFVDAGGYDGLTSLIFARHCPDYRAIHVFEPNPEMLAEARRRLAALPRVSFHAMGLSDAARQLRFDARHEMASASRISDSGSSVIEVDALDAVVHEPVTFIKMDIEGAEGAALAGAAQTLRAHHPALAICVYHKPDDFWRLAEQVLAIRDDYRLYLRHYTEGTDETVMYFVPAPA